MLTKKQLQLYNFLKSYSKEHHIMPSFEEMKVFMNVKSKSVIHTMLGYIEWKGFIKKYQNKARAIEIIKEYNL
jgi:repressor LexA